MDRRHGLDDTILTGTAATPAGRNSRLLRRAALSEALCSSGPKTASAQKELSAASDTPDCLPNNRSIVGPICSPQLAFFAAAILGFAVPFKFLEPTAGQFAPLCIAVGLIGASHGSLALGLPGVVKTLGASSNALAVPASVNSLAQSSEIRRITSGGDWESPAGRG